MNAHYCQSFIQYARRRTKEVNIGGIPMGGDQPIRIQSMTNTLTCDVTGTVEQIERIVRAGADYIRLTLPGSKDLSCLELICDQLRQRNCKVPLIADIHFNPELARVSAPLVDKVRINPGNFVDRKHTRPKTYSDEAYEKELIRLRNEFSDLLEICSKHKTALRIGTNHGSLSDRIMSRFGDTPEGMAESAMEFLRVCRDEKFDEVVVSMKASNTRIMVYATRLLLRKMEDEGMNYPLHLGVTEAGEGEDGRIRSAVGIGAMLADGIGETIRVSLTEDPEDEIPVCRKITNHISEREGHSPIAEFGDVPIDPYSYKRRESERTAIFGDNQHPVVFTRLDDMNKLHAAGWKHLGFGRWETGDLSPDIVIVPAWDSQYEVPPGKCVGISSGWSAVTDARQHVRLMNWEEYSNLPGDRNYPAGIHLLAKDLDEPKIGSLKKSKQVFLVLNSDNANRLADLRSAIFRLMNRNCMVPVIVRAEYHEPDKEWFQLKASMDLGGLFIDGLPDGIWLENSASEIPIRDVLDTAFGILQASRVRMSRTEYISCPSCGRTLFDLQTATRRIRERTRHLKGLKIGIMGCIVNGPGEMADADYGYVGAGKGKVTLYKEKQVVRKNIPEEEAVDELIKLIQDNGDWTEP